MVEICAQVEAVPGLVQWHHVTFDALLGTEENPEHSVLRTVALYRDVEVERLVVQSVLVCEVFLVVSVLRLLEGHALGDFVLKAVEKSDELIELDVLNFDSGERQLKRDDNNYLGFKSSMIRK